jgi:hypothetical protein
MIVCHALAQNDELTYNKFLRKMAQVAGEDKHDVLAARLLGVINDFRKK